jgi:hypothetical protein
MKRLHPGEGAMVSWELVYVTQVMTPIGTPEPLPEQGLR